MKTRCGIHSGPGGFPILLAGIFTLLFLDLGHSVRAQEDDGFVSIFNGKDLSGWDGKPGWWAVEDGAITAQSTPEKPCRKHNYLIWRGGQPADFELRLLFRLQGGNSGVQFRSLELPDWDTSGYQADMDADDQWTGALFEHARGGIAMRGENVVIDPDGKKHVTPLGDPADLRKHIRKNDWNEYRVLARGNEITLCINGVMMSHAIDRQTGKAARRGILAFQMHPGPPMKVQFKKIRLKTLHNVPAEGRAPPPPARAAAEVREPTATPVEEIKILKDFKLDLLYSPSKTQGSWVSMCVDAKGRLIVCDQYDGGLYRVTPPPAGGKPAEVQVEKINVDLSGAQGLLWAFDSLYVLVSKNGRHESGLYRVRDTNGDDQLDTVELLRRLGGGGDHGWHGLLLGPDGKSIYVVAGNATQLTDLAGSRVPLDWSEDHLLPRLPDARGFMVGVLAPGGCFYRVDPEGRKWELVSVGFRNTYDAAFNRYGDLFTYDADMEWDMNTPWYRPTRVCLVTSGSEFGWRNGAGKWPPYYADSLPPVLEIGPGSPTGMTFGDGAKFPARYQEALFLADWSYGRIYAVHWTPDGAAYRGEAELFMSGAPLPTTDIVVNPKDGAIYFVTGGWRIQTGLYRVSYAGSESTAPAPPDERGAEDRAVRRKLESFHGRQNPEAVKVLWPYLGHADRFIRFAARVALEWQDRAGWQERALNETNPQSSLTALMALVRVSARDPFHRKPADPSPDPTLQTRALAALNRIDWNALTEAQRLEAMRCYTLVFTRLGRPDESARLNLIAKFDPLFPASTRALNAELCQMLVYLQAPGVARKALDLAAKAPTQEEQIEYIKSLRMLRTGWTPDLRKAYFGWFLNAAGYRGGASFAGFLRLIKNDALAALTPQDKAELKPILEAHPTAQSPLDAMRAALAGRSLVKEWTLDELGPRLERELKDRDFERGRRLFGAAGCFACHRFANEGGAVGPDLTSAGGRFSPRDLLESIIEPSKTVSDLYATVVITKTDGETFTGHIVYLGGDNVQVNTDMFNPSETVTIDRKQIKSIELSKVSPMPEGLLNVLHDEEIFDLVAYVLSGGDAKNQMFRPALNKLSQKRG